MKNMQPIKKLEPLPEGTVAVNGEPPLIESVGADWPIEKDNARRLEFVTRRRLDIENGMPDEEFCKIGGKKKKGVEQ